MELIPQSIEILPMSREDLPQVMAIEQVSFPLPYSQNLFEMELGLDVAHMLVAKCEGEVWGYLDFWHVDQEMHVINIASKPDIRRKGVASRLMDSLVDYGKVQKVEVIFLNVRGSNRPAIRLYEKFGFKQIDIRKGYYQDNEEDALVMEKRS